MKKKLIIEASLITTAALAYTFIPKGLTLLGLHPDYGRAAFDVRNSKALIITTSQEYRKGNKKTGVFASELTTPYYNFMDTGILVDIASIKGGKIPFEPMSLRWPLITEADKRFIKDANAMIKTTGSIKIDDVNINDYDVIYIAGGFGAAYDLSQSEALGQKISEAIATNKPIGAVCHGVLGLLHAKNPDGTPFLKGKNVTGISNRQLGQLLLKNSPTHAETEIKKVGAYYEKSTKFIEMLANHVVVDNKLITGQNQNASGEVVQKLIMLI